MMPMPPRDDAEPSRPSQPPILEEAPIDYTGEPPVEDSEGWPAVEPWYFRFIWAFAHLVLVVSAIVFGVAILALGISWLSAPDKSQVLLATLSWVAWELSVLFACAAILLFLDMARSFRSL